MRKERILVVEDSASNRQQMVQVLEGQYEVLIAEDGLKAVEVAFDEKPDAILLDVIMPGLDGYSVIKKLQADDEMASIPVLFITSLFHPEDEAKGLQLGAVDYISKPFSPAVMLARVATHLKLSRQRRLLETYANIDSLTELPNAKNFEATLDAEWGRAKRGGHPLSLALVDLDHFGGYNDLFGKKEGDAALQRIGRALAGGMTRPGDFAARIEGGRFAVIMPDTDDKGAALVAEKVRDAVQSLKISHPGAQPAKCLTVSIGVASIDGKADASLDALKQLVDDRLYLAKNTGRNRVVWR